MDGIDIAVATFELRDGVLDLRPLGSMSIPYEEDLRNDLTAALPPAPVTAEAFCRLDTGVGRAFARAAREGIAALAPDTDLVVSHGQTLYHWVDGGMVRGSLQIGQPAWIAGETGLPVVADLRAADIAVGGQGAPLAALFDYLLLSGGDGTRAAVNIGGIANLTVVGPDREVTAFDTGPGNALIDSVVADLSGGSQLFDHDGARAARGEVHPDLLMSLLADPYYSRPPPKTTGKEHFHLEYLLDVVSRHGKVADDDLIATVTALTAQTIADSCIRQGVEEVIVSGGGVDNPTLMGLLAENLGNVPVTSSEALGIEPSAKEAYFMAMTGFLTVNGLPGNLPSATGAERQVPLGCILAGDDGIPAIESILDPPRRLRVRGHQ